MSEHKPAAQDAQLPYVDTTRSSSEDAPAYSGPRSEIHHAVPEHGHNASLQHNVDPNPDLALHYSHEHQHGHVHHAPSALAHRHDDILYSSGNAEKHGGVDLLEKPSQDYTKHQLQNDGKMASVKEIDTETGGMSPTRIISEDATEPGRRGKWTFGRIYRRYRIVFHLFIWLLFTGYVRPMHIESSKVRYTDLCTAGGLQASYCIDTIMAG